MNTAAKGRRQEWRSIAIYEGWGFRCLRSAGSKGAWDFIAVNHEGIVLVQVRSGRWPSPAECAELKAYPVPTNARKVIHRWKLRARAPEVRNL